MTINKDIRGKEETILAYYGLPHITGNKHYPGECPICGGKSKFRLSEWNGNVNYICVCGNGSLIDLIIAATGKEFKEVARDIDNLIGREFKSVKRQESSADLFINRFSKYQGLRGTQAERYLNSRGIFDIPKRGIRYAENIYDSKQGELSAIVAVAADMYGRACYEHRTYISEGEKAKVGVVKKMGTITKTSGSVAVRLFDTGTALGIAEGIETALSAHGLYKMPVWASLNSSLLKRFKAPGDVETLFIFADNDKNGVGLAAAFECGSKNILSNNSVKKVVIRWPAEDGDFNDVVMKGGISVVEWVLNK